MSLVARMSESQKPMAKSRIQGLALALGLETRNSFLSRTTKLITSIFRVTDWHWGSRFLHEVLLWAVTNRSTWSKRLHSFALPNASIDAPTPMIYCGVSLALTNVQPPLIAYVKRLGSRRHSVHTGFAVIWRRGQSPLWVELGILLVLQQRRPSTQRHRRLSNLQNINVEKTVLTQEKR
jgi:hypothetical protein